MDLLGGAALGVLGDDLAVETSGEPIGALGDDIGAEDLWRAVEVHVMDVQQGGEVFTRREQQLATEG